MTPSQFAAITERFAALRVAVVGDFFLDRYLLIDPDRAEVSIETGLPVHNVTAVRSQPGAAGTIVNNLVALGVGTIHAVGFCGDDGEGYELRRALGALGVVLDDFVLAPDRRTPTYCKPLLIRPGQPPEELSRLDSKNWDATPAPLADDLAARLTRLADRVDAMILMDQVDRPESGVVSASVRAAAAHAAQSQRDPVLVLADSRRGLAEYPRLGFKMNAAEFARTTGIPEGAELAAILAGVDNIAWMTEQPVFVSLAERGIVGARPGSPPEHVPALPIRGPLDIVGAGDCVTATLTAALAAGASPRAAMTLAMAAASLVVHQLGTTGTASVAGIADLLGLNAANEPGG